MSAFLGPIHHWMYNKIKWHEELLENILVLSESKGFNTYELRKDLIINYGSPVSGELADVISHDNIHGWLQEQVASVELRIAKTITKLLSYNIVEFDELKSLYKQFGSATFERASLDSINSKSIYTALNNYMLEGMPCDGINQVVKTEDSDFGWIRMKCIHSQYWNTVSGDIKKYYELRDSLISGFIEAAGNNYKFEILEDGINLIKEV